MSNIAGLIERLEKATEPDVFLDAAIRKALDMPLEAPITSDCPRYTASIDAALALTERLLGKAVMRRVRDDSDGYGVNCDLILDNGDRFSATGALTWPLAILIATLRALLSQEKANG
jgi:hypothetical protein